MIKIICEDITTFVSKENVKYITFNAKNHEVLIKYADKDWEMLYDVTSVEY